MAPALEGCNVTRTCGYVRVRALSLALLAAIIGGSIAGRVGGDDDVLRRGTRQRRSPGVDSEKTVMSKITARWMHGYAAGCLGEADKQLVGSRFSRDPITPCTRPLPCVVSTLRQSAKLLSGSRMSPPL